MPLFHTPVLWTIGCIAVLAVGALGSFGVIDAGRDRALHDTYFVVAHFRYGAR
jgi:cytochrome c oxidase subunit 1